MLNLEYQTVYDIIKNLCGEEDVYKVLEADEILEKMPKALVMTKVQLSAVIRDLKDREYLDVKYFTPEEYCLLVIKRIDERTKQQGVAQEIETKTAQRVPYGDDEKKKEKPSTISGAKVFWMAFFGALLGSAVVSVIAIIVSHCLPRAF